MIIGMEPRISMMANSVSVTDAISLRLNIGESEMVKGEMVKEVVKRTSHIILHRFTTCSGEFLGEKLHELLKSGIGDGGKVGDAQRSGFPAAIAAPELQALGQCAALYLINERCRAL